jgi:hypothetical protein
MAQWRALQSAGHSIDWHSFKVAVCDAAIAAKKATA